MAKFFTFNSNRTRFYIKFDAITSVAIAPRDPDTDPTVYLGITGTAEALKVNLTLEKLNELLTYVTGAPFPPPEPAVTPA